MRILAALLLLGGAQVVSAQTPKFSFLDLDYVDAESDGGDEATGYGVALSLPFPGGGNYLYGRYSKVDFETLAGDVELERLRAGLGFASPLHGSVSLYTLFSYERFEFEGAGKDDGYGGELGVRALLGNRIDVTAAARYIDLDDAGHDTGFFGQLVLGLTPTLGLYAGYESLFDDDEWRFGVRLTSAN